MGAVRPARLDPRPVQTAALALAAGCAAGTVWEPQFRDWWPAAAILLGLTGAGAFLAGRMAAAAAGLAASLFVTGLGLACLGRPVPVDLPAGPLTFAGRVTEAVSNGEQDRYTLELTMIRGPDGPVDLPHEVRAVLYHRPGEGEEGLLPGDGMIGHGRLSLVRNPGNPGGFDPAAWHASKGVFHTGTLDMGVRHRPLDRDGVLIRAERTRTRFVRFVHSLPELSAPGIVTALTVGSGAGTPDRTRRLVRDTGIAHLFAISGGHLFVIAFLVHGLLGRLLRRSVRLMLAMDVPAAAAAGTIVAVWGYAALAGLNPPVVRAAVMSTLFLAGPLWGERSQGLNSLAVAALLLLLAEPRAVTGASFQLSFAAAGGILIAWRLLSRSGRRQERGPAVRAVAWFGRFAAVSGAAWLATLPLSLHHFGAASLTGIPVNLVVVPLVAWLLLPLLTAGLLLWPFWPAAAGAAIGIGDRLWGLLEGGLDRLPLAVLSSRPPGWAVLLLYAAVAAGLGLRGRARVTGLALAVAALLFSLFGPPPGAGGEPGADGFRILFLAVGHGEATLLFGPDATVLVDTGSGREPGGERAAAAVRAALGWRGVRSIDLLVISHCDSDHVNGVPALIEQVPVARAVAGTGFADDPECASASLALERRRVPVTEIAGGSPVRIGTGRFAVTLWRNGGAGTENDGSLVARFDLAGGSALFTGDLELPGIAALRRCGLPLPAGVLKVPHHGSPGAHDPELIRAVGPAAAVVCAADAPGRFPGWGVVRGYAMAGVPLFVTGRNGAVECRVAGVGAVCGPAE